MDHFLMSYEFGQHISLLPTETEAIWKGKSYQFYRFCSLSLTEFYQ